MFHACPRSLCMTLAMKTRVPNSSTNYGNNPLPWPDLTFTRADAERGRLPVPSKSLLMSVIQSSLVTRCHHTAASSTVPCARRVATIFYKINTQQHQSHTRGIDYWFLCRHTGRIGTVFSTLRLAFAYPHFATSGHRSKCVDVPYSHDSLTP